MTVEMGFFVNERKISYFRIPSTGEIPGVFFVNSSMCYTKKLQNFLMKHAFKALFGTSHCGWDLWFSLPLGRPSIRYKSQNPFIGIFLNFWHKVGALVRVT